MNTAKTHLQNARYFANLFDTRWKIFGISFGIDPLFDIVPGLTNLISFGLSGYLLYIAYLLRVPSTTIVRMFLNIFLDYIIGSIPLIGFFGDILYKANIRNLRLLESYLATKDSQTVLEGEIIS